MKHLVFVLCAAIFCTTAVGQKMEKKARYFIDVHSFEPGTGNADHIAEAHKKDVEHQDKYGVSFLRYWIDNEHGKIYCISTASDPENVQKTHKAAHGMAYESIQEVIPGKEDPTMDGKTFFLDIHEAGAGNVTADAVAEAHKKDILVQASNGVNFINYWVDEKQGIIYCLSQGPSKEAVTATHKAAHGMLPAKISEVKQGQ